MIDRRQQITYRSIIFTTFNADSALADGRQHFVRINNGGGSIKETESLETSNRQEGRIEFTSFDLVQTGLHIAPQYIDLDIGPRAEKKRFAPQRGGANAGANW